MKKKDDTYITEIFVVKTDLNKLNKYITGIIKKNSKYYLKHKQGKDNL